MSDTPSTLSIWQETQRRVAGYFARLQEDANGQVTVPDDVKKGMAALGEDKWNNDRRVYTFGMGKTAHNILAARAGLIPWWPVLTAAAYFGELDALRAIKSAADKHGAAQNFSSAMTWISHSGTLIDNARNKIEPRVLAQLFEWGADPNYEDGKWFHKALRSLPVESIKVFLDHGGSYDTVAAALQGDNDLRKKITPVLNGRHFMTKTGNDTLVQTQFIPDIYGLSLFRTIFNFRAQRVHEIYEAANVTPVMSSYDFADYNAAMLGDAQDELKKLGGSAPDILRTTGKTLAVPSGLKRKTSQGPEA